MVLVWGMLTGPVNTIRRVQYIFLTQKLCGVVGLK